MSERDARTGDEDDVKLRSRKGRALPGASDFLSTELKRLQDEYSSTSYNKATNKHLGILRAKIAKVKRGIEAAGKHKAGTGFFVKKSGDATVALVGFPSAGKSSLINRLANTQSKTAAYAFTTTSLIPGMFTYRNARIQVFDLPGIIEGAHIGAGGGRTVLAAAKMADLIVFVVDIAEPGQLDIILAELNGLDVFINRPMPDISIQDSHNQGLVLEINESGLSKKSIEMIFSGFNRYNSVVRIRQRIGEDELIAMLSGRSCYINAIVALNKIDTDASYDAVASEISRRDAIDVVPISATTGKNISLLTRSIYDNLHIMTVLLQPKGAVQAEPMVVREGATVLEVARRIHTKFAEGVKYAYITGPSAKFGNQRVGAGHILRDGDVISFG